MRKVRYLLLAFLLTFTLTGCVKYNVNMDIKKDKSMNTSIIMAFDKSFFGDEKMLKDEDKKTLQDKGYTVKDYSEGNMQGVTITKKVKNIDDISTTKKVEYNLSGLLDEKTKDDYIFQVKKGFFKNTYTANFKLESTDSNIEEFTDDTTTEGAEEDDTVLEDESEESDTLLGEEATLDATLDESLTEEKEEATEEEAIEEETTEGTEEETTGATSLDDMDLSKMSAMDISINITLPYPAKNENATKVSKDGKELTWDKSSNQEGNIKFEFEMYNMTNIYICAGIATLLIIILIVIIILKSKGKKAKITEETSEQPMDTPMPVEPVQPIEPVQPVIQEQSQPIAPEVSVEIKPEINIGTPAAQENPVMPEPVQPEIPVDKTAMPETTPIEQSPVTPVEPQNNQQQ